MITKSYKFLYQIQKSSISYYYKINNEKITKQMTPVYSIKPSIYPSPAKKESDASDIYKKLLNQ